MHLAQELAKAILNLKTEIDVSCVVAGRGVELVLHTPNGLANLSVQPRETGLECAITDFGSLVALYPGIDWPEDWICLDGYLASVAATIYVPQMIAEISALLARVPPIDSNRAGYLSNPRQAGL